MLIVPDVSTFEEESFVRKDINNLRLKMRVCPARPAKQTPVRYYSGRDNPNSPQYKIDLSTPFSCLFPSIDDTLTFLTNA